MPEAPTAQEPGGDTQRTILHVDMDAFFASVEIRDNPELRGKPVLVGGAGRRGVVAAASYEARPFGCRSAQPMAVARRLCPHAIVVTPRHSHYSRISRQIFTVFESFSPLVEGLSIDEAFIDITGTRRLHGPPRAAAERLRAEVFARTRLTCSVGIASRKFLAKIASEMNKPDGVTEVPVGGELEFLETLPIGRLWGVGPRARARLEAHGIETVGDLRNVEARTLTRWFGKHGDHLHRLAHAVDPRGVSPTRLAKSISHEDTFATDIVGRDALRAQLLSQATRVADRLIASGLRGRRVQLKIRDPQFRTESRQCTLDRPTCQARVIYRAARDLLEGVTIEGRSFRLTGVAVSELQGSDQPVQQALAFTSPEGDAAADDTRGEALQSVLSAVRSRYGHQALFPAAAGKRRRPGATGAVADEEG